MNNYLLVEYNIPRLRTSGICCNPRDAYGSIYADMATKRKKRSLRIKDTRKLLLTIIVPIMGVIAAGAVVLAILSIIAMPKTDQDPQRGVGANGFRAYEEQGTTLGIDKVVSKDQVVAALGGKAESVSDKQVSNVFNLDDNRGQTLTFDFVRSDDIKSSLYVDVMLFKNMNVLDAAGIYAGTATAGKAGAYPAHYMRAQTMGSDREYRLMVVNGLKVYKFVMVQPYRSIAMSEVVSVSILKQLAEEAKL